jgi:arabinofuranosyltransferase
MQRLLALRLNWKSPNVWLGVGVFVCAVVLGVHAAHYYPFMADDAFISLRYSKRLLTGHGLTWTGDERVEGYSNLTWVLACALLGLFRVDLVLAARLVGALSTLAVMGAVAYAFRPARGAGIVSALTALLGFALCVPIAVWSLGGLEQPLVCAFVAWAIALTLYRGPNPSLRGPCVLLALLALSRPDGALVAGLFAAGVWVGRGFTWAALRTAATLFGSALLAFVLQLIARKLYYNDWVPNPARIKLAFTDVRLKAGIDYLHEAAIYLSPVLMALIAAFTAAWFRPKARARIVPIGFVAFGWAAYVAFVGGDIFPGRRHVVLVIAVSAFAVGELVHWARLQLRPRVAGIGLSFGYVAVLAVCQVADPQIAVAKGERWEWDGEVVGRLLKRAFGAQAPLLAVDPAGCLPYFSELPSIDMLGLNDRYIAMHPPENLGKGLLAHEFGDGKYVLSRKPDLALFCLPSGNDRACFRSAWQMLQEPSFHRDYRLVTFEGRTPHRFQSRIWVKLESDKIGVERAPEKIVLPGYFLAEGKGVLARLNRQGQLVASLSKGDSGKVRQLRLPAGNYRLEPDAEGTAVTFATSGAPLRNEGGELRLTLATDSTIDLTAKTDGEGEARVARVTFERLP